VQSKRALIFLEYFSGLTCRTLTEDTIENNTVRGSDICSEEKKALSLLSIYVQRRSFGRCATQCIWVTREKTFLVKILSEIDQFDIMDTKL
jgi:hypothetical protein